MSASERMPQRQLGELMTELGLITAEQLATVLEVQQRSKRPLGQIIVELGFASGAAVAHALAMQSGGALRTEYGFALGVHPDADNDADDTSGGLPKLRLAPTAVAPPARDDADPPETLQTDGTAEMEASEESAPLAAVPDEPEEIEAVAEVDEVEEVEAAGTAPETEESLDAEPEDVLDEPEASLETPPSAVEAEPAELEQLRAEIERLESALAATETGREHERAGLLEQHERATSEIEKLQATFSEAESQHEQELARLRDEHERATNELEELQTTLGEAESEREHELARLREAREHLAGELDHLRAKLTEAQTAATEQERRLIEEQERHAEERSELAAQRDRLQTELGDALERLSAAGSAVDERDQLRAKIERFEATFAETQAAAAGEREGLLGDVDRLESTLAAAQATHEQELARVREEHEHARAKLDELSSQRDRIQHELGETLERLAVLGPAAEERDELRKEVEELRTANAETQESCATELRRMTGERDRTAAELAEAQELLEQAERVRESQIALTAERDRALAEIEQLRSAAAEAQAAFEEQTRLLADEQDRHQAERESLLAQRRALETELGKAIEQLAAEAAAADERETQLQVGSQRLLEALEAVRRLAAELMPAGSELSLALEEAAEPAPEPEGEPQLAPPEAETELVASEPVEYSLFVPSPNGYELVPQTGVPPQAGETVELVYPDREEPARYEVVRSGRTLPGGDVCVYLAQV